MDNQSDRAYTQGDEMSKKRALKKLKKHLNICKNIIMEDIPYHTEIGSSNSPNIYNSIDNAVFDIEKELNK